MTTPTSARTGSSSLLLEICVDSVVSAEAAIVGGADRLELCGALALGGLTPSAGLTEAVVALAAAAAVPVRAMVRARAGGFAYDAADVALAIGEARALLAQGVAGLVFGATAGDRLDAAAIGRWRNAIGPVGGLTLHRAIDTLSDPAAAVAEATALGFDTILSSGGAATATAGAATLARMTAAARGRCRIMAGAGVGPGNVAALIAATGVDAVHASARGAAATTADDRFGFGHAAAPADATTVRALRTTLDRIRR